MTTTTLSFTPSQRAAVEAFSGFLSGPEQVFLLKGAAGTGKTTIVAEFIRILEAENRKFALMAPTGRAAFIIGHKTGHGASTIHRGIYALKELKPGKRKDSELNEDVLHARYELKQNTETDNFVYIVDESSMIGDSFSENEAFSFGSGRLLSDLFRFAGGRKIVFVGDNDQLPPIDMNFSPALDKDYIRENFKCAVLESTLSEVMRQKAGVILDNAGKIRESIDNKIFINFHLEEGSDTHPVDLDLLKPYYEISGSRPDFHSVIISFTNRQALQYNQAVRRHFFGENAGRLIPGDLLMIARNNYAYGYELFNGNITKVESCSPDNEVEVRNVKVKIGKDRTESVELRFRKVALKFNAGSGPATVNARILDNFLEDDKGSFGGLTAQALIVDFENRLPRQIKDSLPEIRKALREEPYLPLKLQEIYDSYTALLQKDPYLNAVICKYGYALTCHKAQGGEWDNVFVDMGRFGGTSNENYFRWAYTALTRASKCLWHYRSPDFNYISNLVVEPIQKSDNIRVSSYCKEADFCHARFERIKDEAEVLGLTVTEDKSKDFQHRISFSDVDGNSASFILWYNKKGYSNRDILQKSSSDELTGLANTILDKSYIPDAIPFSCPGRPFAEKLVSFMVSLFDELGINLLDITQENYQDVFHVKTDGYAKICFYYTDKGNYSYLRLISSLGDADEKLSALRQKFL